MQFNFSGGPLDSVDVGNIDLPFAAFGFAAMAWARLETHLDALLIQINKRRFSQEIFDPAHPVSFSKKLRLLKKWFGRHEALSHSKSAIDTLARQLKTLSDDRNSFMHALFSAYNQEKSEITLRSISYVGNEEFHIAHRIVSTKALIRFGVIANSANQSLAVITSALFTADAVESLGKP